MLNKTLISIAKILDENQFPYMIIGGYAVLYHAHARFTEDIDIVLGVDIDELDNVLEAISDNFIPRPENPAAFVRQTNVIPLAEKETDIRVDLIFSFLPFERRAIDHSITATVEDYTVNIVQAGDLVIYKLLAGRSRDLDDIRSILRHKMNDLATDKIESQVKKLSVLLSDDSLIQKWNEIYQDFNG